MDVESLQWADDVAERIDRRPNGTIIRLGEHVRSNDGARHLGHVVARMVCDGLIRRGAPRALRVEIDKPQMSVVPAGQRHRTLLPHHDGGNASYLTPSIHDDRNWNCEWRRTTVPDITTTRNHKLYQGFILQHVGDAESATTYYDLLMLVRLAHAKQSGRRDASAQEIARWLGHNIRRALEVMAVHGGTYLTLGGMLGASRPSHVIVPVHQDEAALTDEQIRQFPDLEVVSAGTKDGRGASKILLDRTLRETTGRGWDQVRQQVEVAVHGRPHDLILGHNITLLHGGWRGGRGRVIEPICFVMERAEGIEYEQWLARAWRR